MMIRLTVVGHKFGLLGCINSLLQHVALSLPARCHTKVKFTVALHVQLQAPAGSPSDVWWQAVVHFISSACDDLSESAFDSGTSSAEINTARGFLQQLQHEGKQLVQQLQSQLDQEQQHQQQPQGTAELAAEQRQQLVVAVAAIGDAVLSMKSVIEYLEEKEELNKSVSWGYGSEDGSDAGYDGGY